ncbi:UNVERIFIED_CONTAM: hypothetical protein PYX00_011635 [Menopon gallinae]|uniref:USP domain-containing protein n=1 Tax=Menopon gallinae TaxID=328185 RepID=A0AAW2H862_9NEOP
MVKRDSSIRLGPKGLRNRGNFCFLNAAMQCVLSQTDLATFYSTTSGDVVTPEDFIQQLRGSISLLNGKQQDSHEFLLSLMHALFRELEHNSKEVYGDMQEFRELQKKNFVAGTFYGMLQTSVTCSTCLKRFKCTHHFSTLSLNVFPDIATSLKFFTQENSLEKDNRWVCENCHASKSSKHRIDIIDYPKVLIVHLMRFDGEYRKDNRGVNVEEELVLDGNVYEVFGLVCHSGVLNSGHYIAYAKRLGTWYCFDDEHVSKLASGAPLRGSSAYLIFYQRK